MPGTSVAPRHRAPRSLTRSLTRSGRRLAVNAAAVIPTSRLTGALALVGAASVAVGVGVVVQSDAEPSQARSASAADQVATSFEPAEAALANAQRDTSQTRAVPVSRSASRPVVPPQQRATKAAALDLNRHELAGSTTRTVEAEPTDPRDIAAAMLAGFGWSSTEFACLDQLWVSESDWNSRATNPSSGAYGIPQSLPAEKMASAGADWRTNPATQIEWGLTYIRDSYGTPCSAWSFKQSNNWY
ncbi:MAG: lytic transglycosylase domain-containing protein [Nocardioidaceae bacterium]